ncbi:MAG: ydeE3 [Anaerocolumna sp.]|nr:ydeE3 [Anaerocolumna sp.]
MDWLAKMNGAIGYIEENLCNDIDYEEVAKSMVAVESDQPLKPGFTEIEIPACQWVKFECRGPLPGSQQKVWKRIYSEWFPSSGYEHTGGPEIEWYSEENMDSEEYYSEIWLPVRRITT